jgi:hypothetical protein
MTLTVEAQTFVNILINKEVGIVQNEFIKDFRNLNGSLITQVLASVDKINQTIDLVKVTQAQLDYLLARNGLHKTCSLTGAGAHNFSGTYKIQLPDNIQNSYNDTQNFTLTLIKT